MEIGVGGTRLGTEVHVVHKSVMAVKRVQSHNDDKDAQLCSLVANGRAIVRIQFSTFHVSCSLHRSSGHRLHG